MVRQKECREEERPAKVFFSVQATRAATQVVTEQVGSRELQSTLELDLQRGLGPDFESWWAPTLREAVPYSILFVDSTG